MLTIGVRNQDEAPGRMADAGLHCRAVAFVVRVSNDDCPGGLGARAGIVSRTIVDDEDFAPARRGRKCLHHGADRGRFVESRYDDRGVRLVPDVSHQPFASTVAGCTEVLMSLSTACSHVIGRTRS